MVRVNDSMSFFTSRKNIFYDNILLHFGGIVNSFPLELVSITVACNILYPNLFYLTLHDPKLSIVRNNGIPVSKSNSNRPLHTAAFCSTSHKITFQMP
jgi:hypothetical protein